MLNFKLSALMKGMIINMAENVNEKITEGLPENLEKPAESGAKKSKKVHKKFPKWLIILLAAILLIAGITVLRSVFGKKKTETEQSTAEVTRGNVTKVIEGEGVITVDQYQATSLVKGEIIACYIEEGDYVEKDQVLYEIDSGDMQNSITRAKNTLTNAENNYKEVLENVNDLSIKAPIGGVIETMHVKNGDQVGNGTPIADIIDSSVMKLKVPFLRSDAAQMYVGETASVVLAATGEQLSGSVSGISTGFLVNADGVAVSTVEIQVYNPGAIIPGNKATAKVGSFACTDTGSFEYNNSETVTAKQSGKIRNLKYDTADRITAGAVIATIENTNLVNSIESARISRDNAKLNLDDLYDTLENYKIKSSISGKVIQKNSKLGDKIDNTNAQTVMAIISDPSELSFDISVDELDIVNIKAGQAVSVTADALPRQRFRGHVDNVSEVGTSTNGVTTYPVKVIIDTEGDSDLIPGMNVDAVITVDSRENVLVVPSSAVQRGNIVYKKKNGDKADENDKEKPNGKDDKKEQDPQNDWMTRNVPDGFEAVRVEVGLSDENNVEITKGLSEGDIVAVTAQAGTSDFARMMQGMQGRPGGMGGMGGAPGGGYSGGGNRTGGTSGGGYSGGGNRAGGASGGGNMGGGSRMGGSAPAGGR